MEKNLEKNLKRYLKRKVKITLGFIVAFLLSCNFVSAEGLYIKNNPNTNKVEFSKDNSTWGENPYEENSFKENIYTNNIELKGTKYGVKNTSVGISFVNKGVISVESSNNAWAFRNDNAEMSKLVNNGKITAIGEANKIGIGNYNSSKIEKLVNNGNIIVESLSSNAWGIGNEGKINKLENNNLIKVIGKEDTTGIGNYDSLDNLINNGNIIVESLSSNAWGIGNEGKINKLENNNLIKVIGKEDTTGIGNYDSLDNLINNGNVITESDYTWGILKITKDIINNGIIEVNGKKQAGGISFWKPSIEKTINNGNIFVKSDNTGTGIEHSDNLSAYYILNNGMISVSDINSEPEKGNSLIGISFSESGEKVELHNIGTIKSITAKETKTMGISYEPYNSSSENSTIENKGIISAKGKERASGISIGGSSVEKLTNDGVISVDGEGDDTSAIYLRLVSTKNGKIENLENNGILASNKFVIKTESGYTGNGIINLTNNGLFIGKLEQDLKDKIQDFNKGFVFKVENGEYKEINRAENSGNIINANLNGDGKTGTESIDFTNKTEIGKIYNGITDTLLVKGKENSLTNSTVNGYTNAVVFDKAGGELTLDNSIINGGVAENSFLVKGQSGNDILSLSNKTIINGNINLGEENDNLNIDNTVQLNGTLDGGTGNKDTLTFNSSATKSSSDKNINILYDIKGFEETNIDTSVTLFEKTVGDNGEIKNLTAQLGNITIAKNGELTLRVDGTKKDTEGKVTGHALYGNKGSITAENGGKLTLNTFGFGEAEVIDFKDTDLAKLKDEDIKLSSALHSGEIGENNTITVSAKKDLEDLDVANYEKLNKIYHGILNSKNLDKFTVSEEQYGAFTKYLHDIYAANPYAYSSELSRKTMSMMNLLIKT